MLFISSIKGYLLFDGYYLVDLDFQFSVHGEIPSFIDAFKFPPSYWHKVVKAGGNPLLYLDLSGPMGVEIKRNTKVRFASLVLLSISRPESFSFLACPLSSFSTRLLSQLPMDVSDSFNLGSIDPSWF